MTTTAARRGVLAVTICLVVSACAGGGEAGTEIDPQLVPYLQMARELGYDDQVRIIEDGVVTFTEYEQAVLAAIACMQDKGLRVVGPQLSADGRFLDYAAGGAATQEESNGQLGAMDQCYQQHQEMVEAAYSILTEPSEEELAERLRAYEQCLRDVGLDPPPGATSSELDDLHLESDGRGIDCVARYSNTASVWVHPDE